MLFLFLSPCYFFYYYNIFCILLTVTILNNKDDLHHVLIIGGGAGGLELATILGNKLGKKDKAIITLVDKTLTHLWKPLLHEVAAGSLNSYEDELGYLGHARWNHFRFYLGSMDRLDRQKKEISLAPTLDEQGDVYIPRRNLHYDTLIIAVGSTTNDFGIKGVREHCMFLDSREEADYFHQNLLKHFYTAHTQETPLAEGQLHTIIAGAGATGIELSAELYEASRQLASFGFDQIRLDKDVKITIVEASDQILPAVSKKLSQKITLALTAFGIEVRTNTRVIEATAEGFKIAGDGFIPGAMRVWSAGIKAPDFLKDIDNLETNNANQLLVRSTLQTTLDDNIFAFGDCAACAITGNIDGKLVPPRAQAAHQQSTMLVSSIQKRVTNKTDFPVYRYVDFGSLVSLGSYTTVGSLMGSIAQLSRAVIIEGVVARLVYMSLYKMHQVALYGFIRTILTTLGNLLGRRHKPRMKLH